MGEVREAESTAGHRMAGAMAAGRSTANRASRAHGRNIANVPALLILALLIPVLLTPALIANPFVDTRTVATLSVRLRHTANAARALRAGPIRDHKAGRKPGVRSMVDGPTPALCQEFRSHNSIPAVLRPAARLMQLQALRSGLLWSGGKGRATATGCVTR